jgi:hypothetical protein
MKKIAVTLASLFLLYSLWAQETTVVPQSSPNTQPTRKERRKAELEKEYRNTEKMIDSMAFVLEANYVGNQAGNRRMVLSNLNFVAVDSLYSVFQVGSNSGLGANGIGGITLEGKVTGWKVVKDSVRKSFFVRWGINTNLGHYDISMNVSARGNASASISGIQAGTLVYDGYLVKLSESRVYQGRTY